MGARTDSYQDSSPMEKKMEIGVIALQNGIIFFA